MGWRGLTLLVRLRRHANRLLGTIAEQNADILERLSRLERIAMSTDQNVTALSDKLDTLFTHVDDLASYAKELASQATNAIPDDPRVSDLAKKIDDKIAAIDAITKPAPAPQN